MPDIFNLYTADPAAVAAAILADTTPTTESKSGAPGTAVKAPRADHSHPRLTSSTTGTTDANGGAAITFTRLFTLPPSVAIFAVEDNTNPPPAFKVRSWTMDGNGAVIGCTIYGSRTRALPTITPLSTGILALGTLITGINSTLNVISGFMPNEAAANVSFTIIAVQTSAT